MKLSKNQIKKMSPGQVLTVVCDNIPELDSVYQVALQARKEISDKDIGISRSTKTMSVCIRVTEKEVTDG